MPASANDAADGAAQLENAVQDGPPRPADGGRVTSGEFEAPGGCHAGDKRKHSEAAEGDDTRTESIVRVVQVGDVLVRHTTL